MSGRTRIGAVQVHRRTLSGKKKRQPRRSLPPSKEHSFRGHELRLPSHCEPGAERLQTLGQFGWSRSHDGGPNRTGFKTFLQLSSQVDHFGAGNPLRQVQDASHLGAKVLNRPRRKQEQLRILIRL